MCLMAFTARSSRQGRHGLWLRLFAATPRRRCPLLAADAPRVSRLRTSRHSRPLSSGSLSSAHGSSIVASPPQVEVPRMVWCRRVPRRFTPRPQPYGRNDDADDKHQQQHQPTRFLTPTSIGGNGPPSHSGGSSTAMSGASVGLDASEPFGTNFSRPSKQCRFQRRRRLHIWMFQQPRALFVGQFLLSYLK